MTKNYNLVKSAFIVALFVFSGFKLYGQISLSATAGTLTGTYTTLSAAFAAVNAGTHQGAITISVTGNTTEPAAPVALGASGVGTASFTTLEIRPTVPAIIAGAPNAGNAVVNFNGSDNILLDGSITFGGTTHDLTIQNTNANTIANTAAIRLIGQTTAGTGLGINGFLIQNCNIIGNTPGNNGTSGSTVTTSYGIYCGSNSTTALSATTAGADYDGLGINNNTITSAYIGVHVYAAAANQSNNLNIVNNSIGSSTLAQQIGFKGINVYHANVANITNNQIFNIQVNTSLNPAGIEIGGTTDGVRISRNNISTIWSTSTGGWGAYGVNLVGGNNTVVDNNSISDIQTTTYSNTSTTYNAFGIRMTAGTGHKIYYNSVHLSGNYTSTSWTAAGGAAMVVSSTAVTGLDIRNNIFSNTLTSVAATNEFSAVWFPTGYNFLNASLERNYYSIPNDANHFVGKVGLTTGTGNYSNLAAWQAISQVNNATNDVNSKPIVNSVAPFTSNTNLLPMTGIQTAIESGALPVASLGLPNVDITNANRPVSGTNPDMGAYEFNGLPISCPQPLNVTLIESDFTTAQITWAIGGSETTWQIQYGPTGFTLGTGTSFVTTDHPDTITGLTANNFYQVYVRAICGAGDTSLWTGPLTFNTYNQGAYIDWSNECPASGFIDISTTGTNTGTTDDSEFGVALPFPLLYQGTLINDITIGNNGGVILGTQTGGVGYTMVAGNGLYPYVQDMNTPYDGVYYQTIGTAPNRKFVVMWSDVAHYFSSLGTDGTTFELIIDEATNEVYYVYEDVIHDNTSYDNGADAEIGIRGTQNINVSMNNTSYLQNNSCVRFYYTNCPKPQNFVTTFLGADEIQFGWSAGYSNETAWIIEYGQAGFTPGTGTIMNMGTTFGNITGLTQLTDYTIYIYANCANGDTSLALIHNFTTLPYCSNPSALMGQTDVDSLELTWNWVESSPIYPVTSFNIQYGMTGFPLGSGTMAVANGINFADTIMDAALMGSGVYQVYIQAECAGTNDTSSWVGPISLIMPLSNDIVCSQEALAYGVPYTFNNNGATVSLNEVNIAPPATGSQTTDGWVNSTLNGTLWYTFVAPSTGFVRINSTAIPGYNGQAAVYSATNCGDFNTFTLLAANDDAIGGTSLAPNFTVCGLTPGTTYYVMFDKFNATSGNFSIQVDSIYLDAGLANPIVNVCYGDTVNLFNSINGYQYSNGVWSSIYASVNASISDSLLMTEGLAYQVYNLQYRLTDGCAYDSIMSQVQIYPPSNAGEDGTITACRNQPINLLSGLNGNADLNGSWYDPSNVLLPSGSINTANFPGQYNYDYISGNGVCPNDTANVVVTVTSCNWLGLEETVFEGVNVYPNPTTGLVFIDASFENGSFDAEVTDMNGRVITTNATVSAQSNSLNLSNVERGTYFIKLSKDNVMKVYRIVVQ